MFRLLQKLIETSRGVKTWKWLVFPFIVFDDVPDELVDLPNNSKGRKKKLRHEIYAWVVCWWLLLIIVFVLSTFYFLSRSTVFIVSANVEKLSIAPYEVQKHPEQKFAMYPEWKLTDAALHPHCDKEEREVTGLLRIEEFTYIEFSRVLNGSLVITLENDDSDSVGVFTSNKNEILELDDCVAIRLNDLPYVFPIEGNIKLGGDIKESSDNVPILYSGEVTVLDKTFFTRHFYLGEPFLLMMGDVFEIQDPKLQSSGFVHIGNLGEDDKGIDVTYSSKGKRGYVKKYKTEPIEIQNSFWTKIYNDPSLILIWFFAIIFYAICRTAIRTNLNRLLH